MGAYVYTARAGHKRMPSGIKIGRYEFAYKPWWGAEEDPRVARLLAAGDRAAEKLNADEVKFFVKGKWADAEKYGSLDVYYRERALPNFVDGNEPFPGKRVGKLVKVRGRYAFRLG